MALRDRWQHSTRKNSFAALARKTKMTEIRSYKARQMAIEIISNWRIGDLGKGLLASPPDAMMTSAVQIKSWTLAKK